MATQYKIYGYPINSSDYAGSARRDRFSLAGLSPTGSKGLHMRSYLPLLLLVLLGWVELPAREVDDHVGDQVEQARMALQRGPVESGRFTDDQLTTALHVHTFGAQAPRADGPLAALAKTIAAAKEGDAQATNDLCLRWFIDPTGVAMDAQEKAHARRCPPAETCLQLWTMWNHLPPSPIKVRWLSIMRHALRVGVNEKTLATGGLLLGDDVLRRLRYLWSNGIDAYGDWGQALTDPLRRHDLLIEFLQLRSQELIYCSDDVWLEMLERSDLEDAQVLDPLLLLLQKRPDLFLRLARLGIVSEPAPAVEARAATNDPVAILLRAIIRPDQASVAPVIAGLAEPLADDGWNGYPLYWRPPTSDGQPHVALPVAHVARLIDFSGLRQLWCGLWSTHRAAAAQSWATAIPQLPASQTARLFSMLPPAVRLDDPLLLAGLAHADPRVRMLAAHQAALLEPSPERLEACFDLWEKLDVTSRRWLQGPWLQIVALSVRQVEVNGEPRLRAWLQQSAAVGAAGLLAEELSYNTPSTLSAWSELVAVVGLHLPVVEAIDRFIRERDASKYYYVIEDLAVPFILDQPGSGPEATLKLIEAWPLPIRLKALALLGSYDAALALWDAAPDAKNSAIESLLWSRRTAAMIKQDPDNVLVMLGWAERQGLRPAFSPDDMGSRFKQALYYRLVEKDKPAIPWSDWAFSMTWRNFEPVLMLDGQDSLRAEDFPRLLEVVAKRGRLGDHQSAFAALLRRHDVTISDELAVRSPVCADLRLEQAFQDGDWQEVLRRGQKLTPLGRAGLLSLRQCVALQRLARFDDVARVALLPDVNPFHRTLLAEWLVGEGALAQAQKVAASVADWELEAWQRPGWSQARIRLALAVRDPAAAKVLHAAAFADVRDSESWAHLEAVGEVITAATGPDAAAIAAWARGAWRTEADEGAASLAGWRTQAVAMAWKRTLTWTLTVAQARQNGGAGEAAMTNWRELAEGTDWWAQLARRSLVAAANPLKRLMPMASWNDRRRPADPIPSSTPMIGFALDSAQGQPPAIGERSLAIDPWGKPELLYRRLLMGPMTGWWLYLDGYQPMVRSGTWLNLSRVDGVDELHLFRVEPMGLAPPPKPQPAPQAPPPAGPVQLPEVPLFIRLFPRGVFQVYHVAAAVHNRAAPKTTPPPAARMRAAQTTAVNASRRVAVRRCQAASRVQCVLASGAPRTAVRSLRSVPSRWRVCASVRRQCTASAARDQRLA